MENALNDSPGRRLEERLARLRERGVILIDPRQTFVDSDVDCERVCPGVVLYPGTRLHGSGLFLGPRAVVGREGPATLEHAVLGAGAAVDSGFVSRAVLLEGARLGANAHV